MLDYIFYSILSFSIIYILHSLYTFFLNNLTTPKIKDLVNLPTEKYKEIYSTLGKEPYETMAFQEEDVDDDSMMKNELKNYYESLKKNTTYS